MELLADAVGFAEPSADVAIEFGRGSDAKVVVVIPRGDREDLPEARMFDAPRQSQFAFDGIAHQSHSQKTFPRLKGDASLLRNDPQRPAMPASVIREQMCLWLRLAKVRPHFEQRQTGLWRFRAATREEAGAMRGSVLARPDAAKEGSDQAKSPSVRSGAFFPASKCNCWPTR